MNITEVINESIITFNIYAYCVVLSGYIKHRCSYYFLKNNHMDRFPPPSRSGSARSAQHKANRYFSLSGPEENLREYLKEKPIIDLLEQQGVEYKQRISEKEIIVSAGAPKIVSESAHAVENRAVKTDRADMTAERAQSFVDSAKLTLYQPERQTLKFMAEDGYAVLNFDHKLVTAVPQKWRKKYDDYLEENQ